MTLELWTESTAAGGVVMMDGESFGYGINVRGKLDDVLINFQLCLTIDNIFDEQYLAGIKPFGFRLGKPRSVNVGVKYQF
jgi:outer membrane receptor for ferric coprogen and ferric-rhodotorulic acid